MLTLSDLSGGFAAIDAAGGELLVSGEAGPLVDRLLARYDDWRERGSPAATDYESEFVLLDSVVWSDAGRTPARWTLDRVKYRQIVRLLSDAV